MGCTDSQAVNENNVKANQKNLNTQEQNNKNDGDLVKNQQKNELVNRIKLFINENGFAHLKCEEIIAFGKQSSQIQNQEGYDAYFNKLMPQKQEFKKMLTYILKQSCKINESIGDAEILNIIINEIFLLFLADSSSQSILVEKKRIIEMFLHSLKQDNSEMISTVLLVEYVHNFFKTLFLNFCQYILFLTTVPKGARGLNEFFFDKDRSYNEHQKGIDNNYSIDTDKILSYTKEVFLKKNGKELNYTQAESYCFNFTFNPINDSNLLLNYNSYSKKCE